MTKEDFTDHDAQELCRLVALYGKTTYNEVDFHDWRDMSLRELAQDLRDSSVEWSPGAGINAAFVVGESPTGV